MILVIKVGFVGIDGVEFIFEVMGVRNLVQF